MTTRAEAIRRVIREGEALAEILRRADWAAYPELSAALRRAWAKARPRRRSPGRPGPGRPPLLTPRAKKEIVHRVERGEKVRQLAVEYGVHPQTIYSALRARQSSGR